METKSPNFYKHYLAAFISSATGKVCEAAALAIDEINAATALGIRDGMRARAEPGKGKWPLSKRLFAADMDELFMDEPTATPS